jgi:hypothetical protein
MCRCSHWFVCACVYLQGQQRAVSDQEAKQVVAAQLAEQVTEQSKHGSLSSPLN